MVEQELRELDAWIAEHAFGWRVVDLARINGKEYEGPLWWAPDYGDPLNPKSGAMPHHIPLTYSSSIVCFSIVKREIERRGWGWQAAFDKENRYVFTIFGPIREVDWLGDLGEDTVMRISDRLAEVFAETEELAGCLAFKAAVEAANDHPD